jgi:hypothetical protein
MIVNMGGDLTIDGDVNNGNVYRSYTIIGVGRRLLHERVFRKCRERCENVSCRRCTVSGWTFYRKSYVFTEVHRVRTA